MVTLELYNQNTVKSQWCPGCGDFAVIKSLKEALVSLEVHPKDLVIAAGIGCSGRAFAYLNGYSFHGVHGRALPLSTGIKLANEALKVLVLGATATAMRSAWDISRTRFVVTSTSPTS